MTLLVVGSGGREHALIRALKKNPEVQTIYALPGNGGMTGDAQCVPVKATDLDGILDFALSHHVDYAVVAPDDPLVLGCVDLLESRGIPCFGPSKAAAQLEGSKIFAKQLMQAHHIPTADFCVCSSAAEALDYVEHAALPLVIKADGLALGKGVIIAQTRDEARAAVHDMMENHVFGKSGDRVVMETFLTGPEVSVLAFTDGHTLIPMVSSMDHKRAMDGDQGLNTGGMGTVAPNPYFTPEMEKRCMEEIFLPTIRAMADRGTPFKGCLYFGLMLTPDGPKVIEYNCRFGDPETQVVLPLLETDLLTIMKAVTEERLSEIDVRFSTDHCCCVILASKGYPVSYEKGFPIDIPEDIRPWVYVAGAKEENGRLLTNGGRVLGVIGRAPTLAQAISTAYERADRITFENKYCRRDIGRRALEA